MCRLGRGTEGEGSVSDEPLVTAELEINKGWARDGELILAMLLITREPYKVHLRTSAVAIEHLRNDPQARERVFKTIEQLIAEFKIQVRAEAA